MPFEGEQRLGQLFAVHAGCDHWKQHRPRHVHQRGGSAFRTERRRGEPPDVAVAPDAERPVFGAAAHAVHGNCQGQQVRRRPRELIQDAKDCAAVVSAVPGAERGRRGEVGVQTDRCCCPVTRSCSGGHSPTIHPAAPPSQHPAAICGQSPDCRTQPPGEGFLAWKRGVGGAFDLWRPPVAEALEDAFRRLGINVLGPVPGAQGDEARPGRQLLRLPGGE